MIRYPITIVDNFYEDPDSVRDFALGLDYYSPKEQDNSEGIYPGKRTKELGPKYPGFFYYSVNKLLSVFHDFKHQEISWDISNKFQLIDSTFNSDWIHSDDGCVFAAVVYLTPDAPLSAGTSIYRKNNKFDPVLYKKLNEQKFNFYKHDDVQDSRESVNSMFEETVSVSNVYNRLIVYEANQFHGGKDFFGSTPEDSRLTQVFFIKEIETGSYPLQRF